MRLLKSGLVCLVAVACAAAVVSNGCVPPANRDAAKSVEKPKMTIEKTGYGTLPDGRKADLFTLTNAKGMRVTLTNYGAITVGVEVPDRHGILCDVTLGYDTLKGWLASTSYFGATVGRYANRIAKGKFTLEGQAYTLAVNNGENALHGGLVGFNRVLWDAVPVESPTSIGIKFTYLSKDGEEGYPGNLKVTAVYRLTDANEFKVTFSATTDKTTIINMAHHTYWNLSGDRGAADILGHELMVTADKYTPVDAGLIPTGELKDVKGTPMDFTAPTAIGARIAQVDGGYDHNFVLRNQAGKVELVARVHEPKSGRIMEIYSDQPGVQFYSGNFLDGTATGKGGAVYKKHAGFCLETQHYPDSPNQKDFPPVVLRPGETYKHVMIHRFSAK